MRHLRRHCSFSFPSLYTVSFYDNLITMSYNYHHIFYHFHEFSMNLFFDLLLWVLLIASQLILHYGLLYPLPLKNKQTKKKKTQHRVITEIIEKRLESTPQFKHHPIKELPPFFFSHQQKFSQLK